jgi:signal transduction histidine kinase
VKIKYKSKFHFIVDHSLAEDNQLEQLIRSLQEEKHKYYINSHEPFELNNSLDSKIDEHSFVIVFTRRKNILQYNKIKNRILVLDMSERNELGSYEFVNFNSYEDVTAFLEKLIYSEKKQLLQEQLKESMKSYEKIKLSNSQLSNNNLARMCSKQEKVLESLLDLEMLLLKEEQVKNWNMHLKAFSKKHSQVQSLFLCSEEEFFHEDYFFDEHSFVFLLPAKDLFLTIRFKQVDAQSELLELIVSLILRTIQNQDQQLIKSDGEVDFWKKIFSKIPYPMAVISNLGDLLIYNESFAKIGILPKECLRFKDQESCEIHQQLYKIRRIEFPINTSEVSYFVFYTIESREVSNGSKGGSVDELGIISSSIAHELNNPLAGILAAISLLSLEDNWSEDALIDLSDMKNGAKRCKELVEIFLGFSKFSLSANQAPSIKESLDQANNLLRFRMIESNLRLEIKYTATLEVFSHQINSSIMSMILYLILSELMTAFAHERLITQTQVNTMSGEVFEFSNQIVMKLDTNFEYEEKLAQSKLIQHLLVFEKLEINFLKKEIRLIYRN